MTELPIPTGLTFKQIVDRAWLGLSVSDAMFGRTEEEYAASILLLSGMMGQWPFDQLGYDDQAPAPGERSGIEAKWLDAVALMLAERIAPAIGKQMTPDAVRQKAQAYSRLCSVVGAEGMPSMSFGPGTIIGQGNDDDYGPFFTGAE
jgi:hypothetical protein